MTRSEFLAGLKNALENDLNGRIVTENVEYYNSYIKDEVSKGKPEEEVVDELGDPWVIARSIIEMNEGAEGGPGSYTSYEGQGRQPDKSGTKSGQSAYGSTGNSSRIHVLGLDSWWKKLLLILGILGIFMVIIAVIGGIMSLLMPIIVPLIIVMLAVRLIGGRRR